MISVYLLLDYANSPTITNGWNKRNRCLPTNTNNR